MSTPSWRALGLLLAVVLQSSLGDAATIAHSKADRVNVRSRPGFTGEIITQLSRGEEIRVLGTNRISRPAPGEPQLWYRVELPQGSAVWVSSEYVDSDGRVKADVLNLRSGPSLDHAWVARAPRGTLLKPLGDVVDGWLQVAAPVGAFGFVPGPWVSFDPLPPELTAPPPPETPMAVVTTNAPAGSVVGTGAPVPTPAMTNAAATAARVAPPWGAEAPRVATSAPPVRLTITTNRLVLPVGTNRAAIAAPKPRSQDALLQQAARQAPPVVVAATPAPVTAAPATAAPTTISAPVVTSAVAAPSAVSTAPSVTPVPAQPPVVPAAEPTESREEVAPAAAAAEVEAVEAAAVEEPPPTPVRRRAMRAGKVHDEARRVAQARARQGPIQIPEEVLAREVWREGVVIRPSNVQAPTYYALRARDSRKTINFLFTTRLVPLNWGEFHGRVVLVRGREYHDERYLWKGIPLLDVAEIEAAR